MTTLRLSTSSMYSQGLNALLRRQSEVARTQQQLTSGYKLTTAADNPVGAGVAVLLDRTSAELDRYQQNATAVTHRLNVEESTLGAVGDRLTRIGELALQASNDSNSPESRQAIVAELRQQYDGLLALANTADGTGNYLFGGSQDASPPFIASPGEVNYVGNQTQRQVDIGPEVSLADGDPGSEIFQRVRTGNGVFAARAAATNAGSAFVTSTGFTDPGAWDGGSYRVVLDGAGAYQVLDAANALVTSGSYVPNTPIQFKGITLNLEGQPAAGDTFTVKAAPAQDVFTTVQNLINACAAPNATPAQRAAQRNALFAGIEDINQAQTHVVNARASVGGRLNTLDITANEREAQGLAVKSVLSDLRDLDYTEAASRLSQQLTALQAAQETFTRVQGNSLFDHLRG